jgi:hypothetical protein
MKIFGIMFLWALMAAVLVAGVVMAVNGSFWLLIVGSLVFIGLMTKVGILPHS